jgi:signal peptidase II
MNLSRRAVIFVALVIGTFAFDQGSKAWARTLPVDPAGCTTADLAAHRCRGVPQPVIAGFWEWELAANDGVAFSSFRGKRVVLSLLATAVLVWLGIMAWRTKPQERMKRWGLALVFGGALGNLFDRVFHGAVTDFVRWRFEEHRWPIFNVADVALVIGVALLLLESVVAKRRPATLAT